MLIKISVIVPIFNECDTIRPLAEELEAVLEKYDYEIIFVDDGSKDGSQKILEEVSRSSIGKIKTIFFRKNYGQTAALSAGIDHACGGVIITIDGDLENDPGDIPHLLATLEQGYDIVSGWRVNRWKRKFFTRRMPSLFANWLISKISGLELHDHGCTLKAYRAAALKEVKLYGDMHRFIAAYAFWNGSTVTEISVKNRERVYGKSKYGIGRTWRVVLDLVALKFLSGYATRPIHFFGGMGMVSIILGIGSGFLAVYFKLSVAHHKDFIETPLPIITVMLSIVGVVLIMMGLIAEMLMRVYYETKDRPTYTIKGKINF